MAAKSKTGISGTRIQLPQSKPKKSRQGKGAHSKPAKGEKKYRGQGR